MGQGRRIVDGKHERREDRVGDRRLGEKGHRKPSIAPPFGRHRDAMPCVQPAPIRSSGPMMTGRRAISLSRAAYLGLTCAILLAACASPAHVILGSFTLTDADVAKSPTTCHGTGGYSDIKAGLGVLVKDGTGKTLATGSLADGLAGAAGQCAYTFTITVPDSDFYAVSVGTRGELTYSRDELSGRGWSVGFVLGS